MAKRKIKAWACWKALIGAALISTPTVGFAQEAVPPSIVNPQVRNGDTPYLVYGGVSARPDTPLVVFLPGTNGTTAGAP